MSLHRNTRTFEIIGDMPDQIDKTLVLTWNEGKEQPAASSYKRGSPDPEGGGGVRTLLPGKM